MTEDQKKNHADKACNLFGNLHKDHVAIDIPLEYRLLLSPINLEDKKIKESKSHIRHNEKQSWYVHDPEIRIYSFVDKMIEHIEYRIKYTDNVLRDAKPC